MCIGGFMGLLITFILGIFFIIGALVIKFYNNSKLIENMSVSIALGTMASLVILDLIPEMMEHMVGVSIIWLVLLIIVGVVLLKVIILLIYQILSILGKIIILLKY